MAIAELYAETKDEAPHGSGALPEHLLVHNDEAAADPSPDAVPHAHVSPERAAVSLPDTLQKRRQNSAVMPDWVVWLCAWLTKVPEAKQPRYPETVGVGEGAVLELGLDGVEEA